MKKKVLHICLASFYIDNYSYQENLLPKYHKKMGYDVEIIASLFTFDKDGKDSYLKEASNYTNEHNIPVSRLAYKNNVFSKKLRKYEGTYSAIEKSKPDIIFIHGCQFLDIEYVVKYVSKNPNVRIYVDNHADFSNSAKNFLSKHILHKIIWKRCAQLIEPYVTKFYGVLPARVDFLKHIYKIPKEKIELLVMGADDEKIGEAKQENSRQVIREKYNIKADDFLIMTGGKIDNAKKQTLKLMEAVKSIPNKKIKLIVFGSVIPELKDEIQNLIVEDKIQYIGWIKSEDSYRYFSASDLAIFPGRHSVFWEQVVGQGIPIMVKWWEGTTHIDIGNNCIFLYENSTEELIKKINNLLSDKEVYLDMKENATGEGRENFLYSNIAKKSIDYKSNKSGASNL